MGNLYQFMGIVFFAVSCALLYANKIDYAIVGVLVANLLVSLAIYEKKHE